MADPLGPYAIPDLIPLPLASETPTILRFRLVEGALPEQVLPPIEVLEQGSVLQPTRLIQSVPADLLVDLEARAAASALPPLHSLARAWQLDLSAHPELVPLVFEVLADSDLVEEVWPAPLLQPPTSTPDLTGCQGYLEAASAGGVDAKFLWASPGGDGAGVRWIDIEGGWTLNHEDLPKPPLISGFNEPTLQTHGTNVLGVIAGVENGIGVTGIAHGATLVGCISIELGGGKQRPLSDAIVEAITHLPAGSVLLVEEQRADGYPVEVDTDVFDAMRLASVLGIVVIEPAGNKEANLDTDPTTAKLLSVVNGTWRDSGALLVGAGFANTGARLTGTCYGSRVNAWGWCWGIASTGWYDLAGDPNDPTRGYTASFGFTSGAAAMVAGAAIALQGFYQAWTGLSLTPLQMRTVLPSGGTPNAGGVTDLIGQLPDLKHVATKVLGYLPDLYVRDRVGDDGTVPSVGVRAASPDVLVFDHLIPNAQATLGEGSGMEDQTVIGGPVKAGVDHQVYVRARNRGLVTAKNATARVYWSKPSTIPLPSSWSLVGSSAAVAVPANDHLTVFPPILWSAQSLPPLGSHCLVVVVGAGGDPAPLTPTSMSLLDYQAFVGNNNNVAWRNIIVVPDLGLADLSFRLSGDPTVPLTFALEIRSTLQPGSTLSLRMPGKAAVACNKAYGFPLLQPALTVPSAGVQLPQLPKVQLGGVLVPAGSGIPLRFEVSGPPSVPGDYVGIRQYYQGSLIGAVHFLAR